MTEEEARVLAWTLLGEAGGEGTAGMTAIAHVIRNRAASGRFPSNPAAVALQSNSEGYHQFSAWNALDKGGNIPRSRYPVDSADFQKAMTVVQKVFSLRPGADPTQGATHYYSPRSMKNGAAPYWWNSEARNGEKKIGGHIFAIKYDPPVAPIPRRRPNGQDQIGYYPEAVQLKVLRTGQPERLPVIGPRYIPYPATQSLKLQIQREDAGATVKSIQTFVYDPVTKALVPAQPSVTQVKKNIPQSQIERTPAKTVQRVAGFAVPGGTTGMKEVERRRQLAAQTPSYAREPLPASRAQTQFAPSTIPQAAGSVNNNKDQTRAPKVVQQMPVQGPVGDVPVIMVGNPDKASRKVAPVKTKPVQQPPVPIPTPQNTPLRVVVQRDPVVQTIAKPPVQTLIDSGLSPSDAYDQANANARQRARENASSPEHISTNEWFNEVTGRN